MRNFLDATDWPMRPDGGFTGTLDESWYQGRGVYGGIMGAGILRSLMRAVDAPSRLPRSLTVHFCAPATAGSVDIETRIERTGAQVTHATTSAKQDRKSVCVATATFAQARAASVAWNDTRMPEVLPPEASTLMARDMPMAPVFTQHFEYRFAGGGLPYTGSSQAAFSVWVRSREPLDVDFPLAVGLLDAPPPAALARLDTPKIGATVDYTLHFFEPLPRPVASPNAFHLVDVRSRIARDGYTEQLGELWTEDGVLIAQCRQLVALFG